MRFAFLCMIIFSTASCFADDVTSMMDGYVWEKRLVLVFAPSQQDARLIQQYNIFEEATEQMKERDILTWYIVHNSYVAIDGARKPHLGTPPFYRHYQIDDGDFTMLLIGKDGNEKLRQTTPLTAEALRSTIDAMPMRQKEMHGS